MVWLVVIGSAISCWAILSVLGSERQRRLEELRSLRRSGPRATPAPEAVAETVTVVS